jgi:hypothetical protein
MAGAVDAGALTAAAASLLPPRPTGPVDEQIAAKIRVLARHKVGLRRWCACSKPKRPVTLPACVQEQGMDINAHISQKKNFNNPSLYEKLIGMMDIYQTGPSVGCSVVLAVGRRLTGGVTAPPITQARTARPTSSTRSNGTTTT